MATEGLRNEHLRLLYSWLRFQNFRKTSDILSANGFRHIAIYGGAALGRALYECLRHTAVTVRYIIDRNEKLDFPDGLPVVHPDRLNQAPEVDLVVVTALNSYRFINAGLQSSTGAPVVSLESLIMDPDEYQLASQALEHIQASQAEIMMLSTRGGVNAIKKPSLLEKIFQQADRISWDLAGMKSHYKCFRRVSLDYLRAIAKVHPVIRLNGMGRFHDTAEPYFNVVNGRRVTVGQPAEYEHTWHFFGNCWAAGYFAEDKHTIESQLQLRFNRDSRLKTRYCVQNHGVYVSSMTDHWRKILSLPLKPEDRITIIWDDNSRYRYVFPGQKIRHLDCGAIFARPHTQGEIFMDHNHVNRGGYKLIADRLFEDFMANSDQAVLQKASSKKKAAVKNNSGRAPTASPAGQTEKPSNRPAVLSGEHWPEFEAYLAQLQGEQVSPETATGAVVMNCNPFTLGHRYLVERALDHCGFLYAFVLEEDKSAFPFKDRLRLVKEGVAGLDRVKVLPSGRFVISTLTLPEYFDKDSASEVVINPGLDIELFAGHIAPVLNIKRRFAGEEPYCPITRQYNAALAETLPRYGLEFMVFERKKRGASAISASRVRALWQAGKMKEIEKLVPPVTYEYLTKKTPKQQF